MAIKRYVGKQVQRADRYALTVTAVAAAGTVGLTLNGKTVQYLCVAADTTATAAAALVANVQASEDPEFKALAIAVDGSVTNQINIQTNDAGIYLSTNGNTALTVAGAGGSTITSAVVEAGKSPEDGSDTANWSGAALPANAGDDWYFEDAPAPMSLNLAGLAAKAALSLTVLEGFTGAGIGLPKFNRQGGYEEYLGGRLTLTGCTTLTVRLPSGSLPESFRFDMGSAGACAVKVFGAGDKATNVGSEEVDWIGTGAGNTLEVVGGGLKVAMYVGELATVATALCVNGALSLGRGCTVATALTNQGGAVDLWTTATVPTILQDGDDAQMVIRPQTGAVTTLTVEGGTVFHSGTGTVGTLTLGPGATIDFSGLDEAITITNKVLMYAGSTFWDPLGRVTLSGGWQTVHCSAAEVTTNFGPNRNYTVS